MAAAVLAGVEVEDALPPSKYLPYFSPDQRLNFNRRKVRRLGKHTKGGATRRPRGQFLPAAVCHLSPGVSQYFWAPTRNSPSPLLPAQSWETKNKRDELERVKAAVLENLRQLGQAPGAGLVVRPPEGLLPEVAAEDEDAAHTRLSAYAKAHFKHQLWCVEHGHTDLYDG